MNIAHLRLRNQRLTGAQFRKPQDAVRWLGAVQSQDYAGAKWAIAQRTRGVDDAALDRAFDAGEFLRTHIMRPTWHFVAPQDLRWLLALTAPRVQAMNAGVYRMLELDAPTLRRAHRIISAALRDGRALTRLELADVLESKGIPVARGQRLAYIVMHAELSALICSGPLRGKHHTYALLEERVRPAPSFTRDEALATLARRYFTSHGPATAHDFAWWSGLTVAESRATAHAIAGELESFSIGKKQYWTAPARRVAMKSPLIHLLPNYDEHVVAYRDHGPSMDPDAMLARQTRRTESLAVHILVRDGLVIGGWKRTFTKTAVVVTLDLLVPLSAPARAALMRAVKDYGRFVGMPVVVKGD